MRAHSNAQHSLLLYLSHPLKSYTAQHASHLGLGVIAVSLTTCQRRSGAILPVSDILLHILSLPYGFLECRVHSQRCLVLAGLSSPTLKITSLIDLPFNQSFHSHTDQ